MSDFAYIENNLSRVRERLKAAAERGGHPVPTLIAVTKSASDEEVLALAALGVDAMAENRVQRFLSRYELLRGAGFSLPLHLIGSLQTNKVKYLPGKAALLQSLDSERLAAEIQRQGEKHGEVIPVLLEINSAEEDAKGGVLPKDALSMAEAVSRYPNLSLLGLMTMGRDSEDAEDYRPYFRLTKALSQQIAAKGYFKTDAPLLSMGMSHSYEVAAEEGATMVRVGRTLFSQED